MSSTRGKGCNIGRMKGHSLNFGEWADHPQKRHYWGVPNKNMGFYTSQQLVEVERRYKVCRTEPEPKSEPKFIVDRANSDFVHCCTCHNNPKRYLNNAQICTFCQDIRKFTDFKSLPTLKQPINPEYAKTPQSLPKQLQEKSIQVELKLPWIRKHNNKYPSHCSACKDKESEAFANRQKRLRTESPQKAAGDSLVYSFTRKKKARNQIEF